MKLFHTIVIFDAYVVGNGHEDARATLLHWIREEKIKAVEETALEVSADREIRPSWHEQNPYVSSEISDADFEKLKGKTTMEIYNLLYKKQGK